MKFDKLLEPGRIGNTELRNRFVMPPMGTNFGSADGMVTDEMIEYYRRRAAGGFGLLIIEVTAIDKKGRAITNQVGLWEDSQIPKFKDLVDAIHGEGAKVFVQLHHAGRQTSPASIFGMTPEAPSRVACPVMDCIPDKMSNERVWEVIEEFGDAARRAKEAGADGVEVHGAHGYIIAQFMSNHANKRTDEFGGDFAGRMKFPQEIFKNVRKKTGEDFTMTFRFGYDEKVHGGRTLEESVAVARMAEEAGVDAIHISVMTYASMQYMSASPEMPSGFNQFPTKTIKEAVHVPVISVGRYNPYSAENSLLNGCADFISFGRASIADPEIPNKVKEGRLDEIAPCISCTQSCIGYIFTGQRACCLINPLAGNELKYPMDKVEEPKTVLAVGSGPAGLEAALAAAQKGHKVTVVEKEDEFGGQFRLAAVPPTKHEIATALKYYVTAGRKNGVEYIFNTEVTAGYVKKMNPDAVILATGGVPAKPPIKGIDGERIVHAVDILDGRVAPGKNVLMVGGGMTGVETADFLGEHNRKVTILEMRDEIALEEEMIPKAFLMPRLSEHGIQAITGAKVKEFTEDGVIYTKDGEEMKIGGFDTIALAMGMKTNNPLEEALKDYKGKVLVIGDAKKPGPANKATESAIAAVFEI